LVAVVGGLPVQLALAWWLGSRVDEVSAFWQRQYQYMVYLLWGPLMTPALLGTMWAVAQDKLPRPWSQAIRWAYCLGWKRWLGTFLTRLMVGFVLGLAALPLWGGLWLIGRRWPELAALVSAGDWGGLTWGGLFPLLLLLPLALPMVVFYLRYALAEVVVTVEGIDGFEALQRSRELTRGRLWPLLLVLLPLVVPATIVDEASMAVGGVNLWAGAVTATVAPIAIALVGMLLLLLYRHCLTLPGLGPPEGILCGEEELGRPEVTAEIESSDTPHTEQRPCKNSPA
jgi:hypothetical protein